MRCARYTCHCSALLHTCCLPARTSVFARQPCSFGRTHRRLYVSSGLTLCEVGAGQSKKKRFMHRLFPREGRLAAPSAHQRAYAGSNFKKGTGVGHAMRGSCHLHCCLGDDAAFVRTSVCHVLASVSSQQLCVVRSTFSCEFLNGCDTLDHATLSAQLLHAIETGDCSAQGVQQHRREGGSAIPTVLYVEALGVFAACTAIPVEVPVAMYMLPPVQHAREQLDTRVPAALYLVDTRDLLADGVTKGDVDRTALHQSMSGTVTMTHEVKLWKSMSLKD